jgi:hypothetical protein
MNCSGSAALVELVKAADGDNDDPDYRRDGVQAHALGAWCLEHEAETWEAPLDEFPALKGDMIPAVNVYLDFVATLPGRYRHIETKFHRPEFHPQAFGTIDWFGVSVTEERVDIVDYKHGEGVVVEVINNTQLSYYAYLVLGDDREEYPDATRVHLHVVQPRAAHYEGPIRSLETSAKAIRRWAYEVLRPAMERTTSDRYLHMGEWCRFCPAKLVCPAMRQMHALVMRDNTAVELMPDEQLDALYGQMPQARMFLKALENEVERRALQGHSFANAKVVDKRANRAWKEDAPRDLIGYKEPELRSPAEVEKLPGGREFVAEYAFTPVTGYAVAHVSDRRKAVVPKTTAETFAEALKALDAPTQEGV